MAQQVRETKAKQLGLVWLYCPYPVLAQGLIGILREEAWIHYGEQPPQEDSPSCIVFCTEDIESIYQRVKSFQTQVPDAPILVFGLSSGLPSVRAALQAGARGFIHAGMTSSQIIRALSVAYRGEIAVPRELLKDLVIGDPPVDLGVLTSRQQEILKLVVEGWTNAQIGHELFLSESTIKQHLRAAYKALKVRNRTEAARLLREQI